MLGEVFEAAGDEPIYLIDMGDGYGIVSQTNELGQCESIATDANRLRAIADRLDGRAANNSDRRSLMR